MSNFFHYALFFINGINNDWKQNQCLSNEPEISSHKQT